MSEVTEEFAPEEELTITALPNGSYLIELPMKVKTVVMVDRSNGTAIQTGSQPISNEGISVVGESTRINLKEPLKQITLLPPAACGLYPFYWNK